MCMPEERTYPAGILLVPTTDMCRKKVIYGNNMQSLCRWNLLTFSPSSPCYKKTVLRLSSRMQICCWWELARNRGSLWRTQLANLLVCVASLPLPAGFACLLKIPPSIMTFPDGKASVYSVHNICLFGDVSICHVYSSAQLLEEKYGQSFILRSVLLWPKFNCGLKSAIGWRHRAGPDSAAILKTMSGFTQVPD